MHWLGIFRPVFHVDLCGHQGFLHTPRHYFLLRARITSSLSTTIMVIMLGHHVPTVLLPLGPGVVNVVSCPLKHHRPLEYSTHGENLCNLRDTHTDHQRPLYQGHIDQWLQLHWHGVTRRRIIGRLCIRYHRVSGKNIRPSDISRRIRVDAFQQGFSWIQPSRVC
jgi:hypothetical protein